MAYRFLLLCSLVPNVPYGVERTHTGQAYLVHGRFLMYRMELKVFRQIDRITFDIYVPNVPYGVESTSFVKSSYAKFQVPNVPYGVESKSLVILSYNKLTVPNVPYGVERDCGQVPAKLQFWFLMYRMELKGIFGS